MRQGATDGPKRSAVPGRWRAGLIRPPLLLLAPALLWICLFFLTPLGLMVWQSLAEKGIAPYLQVFSTPLYLRVFATTLKTCTITTMACLLLGYPIAHALTTSGPTLRALLLPLVVLPYWLDYIVRSYSWLILLGRRGLVNNLLVGLGVIDAPLKLLYNLFSVSIGMVQILLPLMILTLFGAMLRIDRTLLDAASIHGASRWNAFRTVFFPLSLPGVYGACLLVFVTSLGFYITPALLGGPEQTMISQSIMILASELLDWPGASAAGVLLLAVSLALVILYNRLFSLDRLWGNAK